MKPLPKRTPEEKAAIAAVLVEVASLAQPPVAPELLVTGPGDDQAQRLHVSRLRGIVAVRLVAVGFRIQEVANLFRMSWPGVSAQMKALRSIEGHPSYAQFFQQEEVPTP